MLRVFSLCLLVTYVAAQNIIPYDDETNFRDISQSQATPLPDSYESNSRIRRQVDLALSRNNLNPDGILNLEQPGIIPDINEILNLEQPEINPDINEILNLELPEIIPDINVEINLEPGNNPDLDGILSLEQPGNNPDLNGILSLEQPDSNPDIDGILSLGQPGNNPDLNGILNLEQPDNNPDIDGILSLEQPGNNPDLNGILSLEQPGNNPDLNGILSLEQPDNNPDIDGILSLEQPENNPETNESSDSGIYGNIDDQSTGLPTTLSTANDLPSTFASITEPDGKVVITLSPTIVVGTTLSPTLPSTVRPIILNPNNDLDSNGIISWGVFGETYNQSTIPPTYPITNSPPTSSPTKDPLFTAVPTPSPTNNLDPNGILSWGIFGETNSQSTVPPTYPITNSPPTSSPTKDPLFTAVPTPSPTNNLDPNGILSWGVFGQTNDPTFTASPTPSPANVTTLRPVPTPSVEPNHSERPNVTDKPTTIAPHNPTIGTSELLGFGCINGDGYYAIENECDAYVECRDLISRVMICPDGLVFNRYKPYPDFPCSYPSEVEYCNVLRLKPEEGVMCPHLYGYYTAPGGECSEYIMCEHGRPIPMVCPYGLVFNDRLSACDWPVNVPHCHPAAFDGFQCPTPGPNEHELNSYITKFRYLEECYTYIACERGFPRFLSCPGGLAFHLEEQACTHPSRVPGCGGPVLY